jgi:hypothetical protein
MQSLTVKLERERETKTTVRYREPAESDPQRMGIVYIPKSTLKELGDPSTLKLSLAA